MRRIIRLLALVVLAVVLIVGAALLLSPSARRLMPVWLYYDLIGRQFAPAPAELEQFVLRSGQEYCNIGRDSDCGGYRLVAVRELAIDPPVKQRGIMAAWCVDYAVLRRNQGQITGNIIYWAKIPQAMLVTKASAGPLESSNVADCSTARLE